MSASHDRDWNRDEEVSPSDKSLGMLCHLLGLAGILGPLVLWLVKKDESDYVDYHGREALNFQISLLVYGVVCAALCLVLIGFLLLPALGIAALVLTILAAVKANDGERYRYPMIFRLL